MRNNRRIQDRGASEVIGTVLLISIVVLVASIVAVAVLSQPQAQKIPSVSALISNQSQIVYIKHDGGDSLANGTYEILVDGTDVTSSINTPSTWSIGDTLTYTKPGTTPPSTVQIVYTGAGSPTVIAASYFGMISAAGSVTVTPTSTPTIYYNITASASAGGGISPFGTVAVMSGATQTFTITPNYGYSIANVLIDGSSVGSVSSYTFTNVTTTHTIAASFATSSNTITASAGTGGSISPSGSVNVAFGSNQTFTISPNTGYSITGVLVDGSSVGSVSSYTFTNVTATHTIAASFAINTYTITASAGNGGSISPSGSVNVAYGSNQTFTISPNTGYSITGVLVDGSSVGSVSSYTFTNVTATHTIAASFTTIPVYSSLSPISGPVAGGTIVTILGSGFTGATSVTFGSTAATSFTINSDSQITATTPAHAAGVVSVVITTPGGTATGTNAFTYNTPVIKSFTSSTTWTVPSGVSTVQYLIVGGGGGGGRYGGGGGGGGVVTSTLSVTSGTVETVTIGAGGTAGPNSGTGQGGNGGNSVFATITAAGGGGGGSARTGGTPSGLSGGSGGGAIETGSAIGTANPAGEGYAGGSGVTTAAHYYGGGGGGGGALGGSVTTGSTIAGTGGTGYTSSISGTSTTYAGGGGGGAYTGGTAGSAGSGGGGAGGAGGTAGKAGTANTGGGGGGGGSTGNGGAGGSGIIIIQYY